MSRATLRFPFWPAIAAFSLLPCAGYSRPSQDGIGTVYEVRHKYEAALRQIKGVQEVSIGSVEGAMRLIVPVDSAESRQALVLLTGLELDGIALYVPVRRPTDDSATVASEPDPAGTTAAAHDPRSCRCPCHEGRGPGRTVAEEAPSDRYEQCDWFRKIMKKKPRKADPDTICHQRVGWTNEPEKIRWVLKEAFPHWRSKEMPGLKQEGGEPIHCGEHGSHDSGEVIAYTFVRHRRDCPIGDYDGRARDATDDLTPGR